MEKNEWRFSDLNGWMVASAFLFTVQAFGFQNIRSITIPLPFRFVGVLRPIMIAAFISPVGHIPFTPPAEWTHAQSLTDVCFALRKCDCLHVVNIVVPSWYRSSYIHEATKQSMLDQITGLEEAARGRLKVRLIRPTAIRTTTATLAEVEAKQREIIEECRARGWEIESAY